MNRTFLAFVAALTAAEMFVIGLPSARAQDRLLASDQVAGTVSSAPTASLNEARIKAALDDGTEFEFAETPLSDVANWVSDRHKIPVQFDQNALRDQGIDPATLPITRNLKGIALRSALRHVLSEHALTWLVRDEVLLITTQEKADNTLELRLYDVRDLAIADKNPQAPANFEPLVETIRGSVGPSEIWDDQGGQGTIKGFASNGICALVVCQTAEKHEEIEKLLSGLRRLRPDETGK